MSPRRHTFCCANPAQRIDSPEPPSRPSITIDGLLFAAAALPDDHPHALKLREKKPKVAAGIIRSPNMANKIKLQFRRRSLKVLSEDEMYDVDAQSLDSSKVVEGTHLVPGQLGEARGETLAEQRFGSVRTTETPSGRALHEDVRTSVLKSFDWLQPLLRNRNSSAFEPSARPSAAADVADIAAMVAVRHDAGSESAEDLAAVPKLPDCSVSSPNLLRGDHLTPAPLRRTQSGSGLGTQLMVLKSHEREASNNSSWPTSLLRSTSWHRSLPPPADFVEGDVSVIISPTPARELPVTRSEGMLNDEREGGPAFHQPECAHLQTMDISQQLRSMSALSDETGQNDSPLPPLGPWSSHRREQSETWEQPARSRHSHQQSTLAGTTQVRVKSPATSSIYSCLSSVGGPDCDASNANGATAAPYTITAALDGAVSDWPLKAEVLEELEEATAGEVGQARQGTSLAARSSQTQASASGSTVTAANSDKVSIKRLTPIARTASLQSKQSSSTLSAFSKRSRFVERFSPPKKDVRKRRSIFQFLRAGSRKQQCRSISSPMLRVPPSTQFTGLYDGPADDPALLTVQYELAANPHHTARSASFSQPFPRTTAATYLAVPGHLQRRPSLADYERSLTTTGDDRRRPSTVSLRRLVEVVEDDRRMSADFGRKLSRAKPLGDDAEGSTGLMAQALEKHQKEKAFFRSTSKQRESFSPSHGPPSPAFRNVPLAVSVASVASLSTPPPNGHDDLIGPQDSHVVDIFSGRSQSINRLKPPGALTDDSLLCTPATAASDNLITRPATPAVAPPISAEQQRPTRKIGTTLKSWSRFSSHTRPERCGSAGQADAVIARDFGINNSDDSCELETDDAGNPKSGKGAIIIDKRIPKRRSTTFGGLLRYYSNVFSPTDAFGARNRRTSVSKGGWLANPDLEMLPHTPSHERAFPHHDHHFKQRLQQVEQELEDTVRKDVQYVEAEMQQLERQLRKDVEYVEKEAGRLEAHIRKDIQHLEKEAEQLMHHQHHSYPGRQHAPMANSLFGKDSPFLESGHPHLTRESTFMDPLDNAAPERRASDKVEKRLAKGAALDGAGDEFIESKKQGKAEVWSNLYRDCLTLPDPSNDKNVNEKTPLLLNDGAEIKAMLPPALKPAKARSPEQPKGLNPKASVRRFPSVTVVDDRMGHSRSVSLISVQVGRDGVFRSSTHDFLQLIQKREQEEREKLFHGGHMGGSAISGS